MIFQICLLFYAVACYTTKALVIERTAREGEKVRLYPGGNVDTWRRERTPGVAEFIKYCEPDGVGGPHCWQFVTQSVISGTAKERYFSATSG
ncbi:unnamed protein product [Heligmosomoides polygyrus]|uniref:Secreted protein n=1 Tax=Heligmosomoides polygyrus TaxID=6339 RepID=A0A183G531_HELPZ|nr:unnamed protein product [Heligmosomoides polygyrus]